MALRPYLLILVTTLGLATAGRTEQATAPAPGISVLLLSSFHKEQRWTATFEIGFKAALGDAPGPATIYYEFMDALRFPPDQNRELASYLQSKYGSKPIDVIVAESLPAAKFLTGHPELLPRKRRLLVISGASRVERESATARPQAAADELQQSILLGNDYRTSFKEMLQRVRPKQVFVVADVNAPTGKERLKDLQEIIAEERLTIPVEYVTGLTIEEYQRRLSALPAHSAIYYQPIFRDAAGKSFSPYDVAERIAAVANAPVFTHWDTLIGGGIVGGYVVSAESVGRLAAAASLAVQRGEPPRLREGDGFRYEYDWRALKRWGIDETTLPPGSVIRHRHPGLFERYRVQIIASVIALLLLGMLIAITALRAEVRRRTRQLERAKTAAESANHAKSAFLATISHEIRTPLNAIIGTSYLLGLSRLAPEQQRDLEAIKVSSKELLALIDEVLDFSKIEAGELEIHHRPFALHDLMHDLGAMFAGLAARKGIALNLPEPGEDIPKWLVSDELRLMQMLANLLNNAVKFTAQGQVSLQVSRVASDGTGVRLRFAVSDTGIGIAADIRDRLFQPFTQADSSTGREFGGTGLGLSIVKRLAELMGGSVGFESGAGRGSTFWIELPVQPAGIDERAAQPRPFRLLVIAGDANERSMLVSLCQDLGWRAQGAATASTMIELLAAGRQHARDIDCVLIDVALLQDHRPALPEMIRQASAEAAPPALVALADKGAETAGKADYSADATLLRPVTASALAESVIDLMTARQPELALVPSPAAGLGSQRLHGIRIMVVDDNRLNLDVVGRILEKHGASVTLCGSAEVALDSLRSRSADFDALLMDLQMPGIDGCEATRRIRGQLGLIELKIIAITAGATTSEFERACAAGMNDFLTKPVEPIRLVSTICQHVKGARPTSSDAQSADLAARAVVAPPEWPSIAGIDANDAATNLGGDVVFFREILDRFLDEAPNTISLLHSSLHEGNAAAAARHAHKLCGQAGHVGARALHRAAGELEQAIIGNAPDMAEKLAKLDDAFKPLADAGGAWSASKRRRA